ncbi:MAG: protein-disulfide reductase DsbD domain-containing protein [bacterium]
MDNLRWLGIPVIAILIGGVVFSGFWLDGKTSSEVKKTPSKPNQKKQSPNNGKENVVSVELSTKRISFSGSDTAGFKVVLRLGEGWHVNANPASLKYLIPTTVQLVNGNAVTVRDVDYPPGQSLQLGFASEPLSVYEGKVRIPVVFEKKESGSFPAKDVVKVRYQACNDEVCLRPRVKKYRVSFET